MGFFDRFIPGPGPGWPYTNFQQINLDWIIHTVKELFGRVVHVEEDNQETRNAVEDCVTQTNEAVQYIENLDQEIQRHVTTEINAIVPDAVDTAVSTQVPEAIENEIATGGFNTLLSASHKRRVVFLGDSYCDGWTPDGSVESWASRMKTLLYLAEGDYIIVSQGGAGFMQPDTEGLKSVSNQVDYAFENISDPSTVTDIIMGFGYNDRDSSRATIISGIERAVVKCTQKFKNARRHLFGLGFGTNPAEQYKLRSVYNAYKEAYRSYQFYNISDALCVKSYFSSDGVHPNGYGQRAIAVAMMRALDGSEEPNVPSELVTSGNITFDMVFGGSADVSDWFALIRGGQNRMYFTTVSHFKNVSIANPTNTITGAQLVKLAKIKNCPLTGFHNYAPFWNVDTIMYYQVVGSDTFYQVPVGLTIASDEGNNDTENVYLWLTVKSIADDGVGFKEINNIKTIGFIGACIEVPFITKT